MNYDYNEGYRQGLEKAKEVYRGLHPGKCRMFSRGLDCHCFLCQIDNEHRLIKKIETPQPTSEIDIPFMNLDGEISFIDWVESL